MAIRIVIDDRVKFTVKGSFTDRAGRAPAFSFQLVCDRLQVEQIEEALKESGKYADFFAAHTHDWDGVQDADGQPLPYGEQALRDLFKLPGLPRLTWERYLQEVGAKEKN